MKTISSKTRIVLSVLFFVFIGLLISLPESNYFGSLFVEDAEARVGRPATPASGAGVARRTSRRTTRRVVHRHTAVVYGARVTVLPVGYTTVVVSGSTYYVSGGTYYQPHYEGNTVVYVTVVQP